MEKLHCIAIDFAVNSLKCLFFMIALFPDRWATVPKDLVQPLLGLDG